MANPIVVFVIPNRFGSLSALDLPVGVSDKGNVETAKSGESYSLLLLDDTQCPPGEAPCHFYRGQPLLVVAHNRTDRNAGPWDALWGVRSPTVCKRFSHIDEDPVFVGIVGVLSGQKKALDKFVQDCHAVNILQALDGLAAICQIEILDSEREENIELGDLENELLHRLPDTSVLEEEVCPRKRLDLIRKMANDLLSITTTPTAGSGRA